MARQVSEVTQQEADAYAKFAQEHNIIHDGSVDDQANAELVLNYFCNTWPNVISEKTLTQAFAALKPHLRFKSAARLEAEKAARENSTISQKFSEWFDAQNIIVKDATDQGYLNFAQLLRELRGREVTTDTIFQAMGRISYRPGRQLAYVQKKGKQVDPSYRPGQFITDYNVTPGEHQRRLRASRTQEQESPAARHSRDQAAAQSEAESLRGWSHSENAQLSRIFVTDEKTREIDWVATRNARLKLQKTFENRRATSYRIT
jgi:hypothetical protein